MAWSEVAINREQPQPTARKGHSATIINGSRMLIFGGSSWVPEPSADNSYGHTTRHVDDLWLIDLSGEEGHTWRAVHSVGDRPSPREGHAAVLIAGRYLVIQGGCVRREQSSAGDRARSRRRRPHRPRDPPATHPVSHHLHLVRYAHETGYHNDTHVLDTGVDPMAWSRPTLTGDVPRSRHGQAAVALAEDDELLSFGGMSRYGYENSVHILQVGVGNAHIYPGLTHPQHGGDGS